MSYAYLAAPVTFAGPSRRLTRVPTSVGCSGHGYLSCCFGAAAVRTSGTWGVSATAHPLGIEHCFEHACVRAAATDVAGQRGLGLFGRRLWILLEQRCGCHDEAWRAEAAHQPIVLAEGLLDRVKHGAGR